MVRLDATLCVVALALALTGIFHPPTAAAQQASGTGGGASAPAGSAINYDTARFERRLIAVRAAGAITLDGNLSEPA